MKVRTNGVPKKHIHSKHEDATRALKDFLKQNNITPEDIDDLISYLNARPEVDTSDSYLDNVEARVEMAHTIHRICLEESLPEAIFTTALWSAFMVAPFSGIKKQYHKILDDRRFCWGVENNIFIMWMDFQMIFKIFLDKPISESDSHSFQGSLDKVKSISSSPNDEETSKCLSRDSHRCVVTNMSRPEACCIFPFVSIQELEGIRRDLHFTHIVGGDTYYNTIMKPLLSDESILGTANNMISLDPNIHRMWRSGMVGFEPLSSTTYMKPEIKHCVKIRLHWLPKSNLCPRRILSDFNLHPKDVCSAESNELQDPAHRFDKIRDCQTGRLIKNGSIIEISATDREILPSLELLALQWDIIRMISLCGADVVDNNAETEGKEWDGVKGIRHLVP